MTIASRSNIKPALISIKVQIQVKCLILHTRLQLLHSYLATLPKTTNGFIMRKKNNRNFVNYFNTLVICTKIKNNFIIIFKMMNEICLLLLYDFPLLSCFNFIRAFPVHCLFMPMHVTS